MDEDHARQRCPDIAGDHPGLLDLEADCEPDEQRQRVGADQGQAQPDLGTAARRRGERRAARIPVNRQVNF